MFITINVSVFQIQNWTEKYQISIEESYKYHALFGGYTAVGEVTLCLRLWVEYPLPVTVGVIMWLAGLCLHGLESDICWIHVGELLLTNEAYNIRPIVSMTTHQPQLSIRKLVE